MVVYRKESNNLDPLSGTTAAQSVEETTNDAGKSAPIITHMVSRAILTCRPNSHPFQERHLALDQPIKVGRSVARCRPALSNAIFDCKVLSRNHALLWYENGKFFLQDTKSSNGTFVNNQRLSKSSEESAPREVCSGDIVQFGVDVVENSRKVVHGCIVATLKLYLPDGKEAKASPTTAVVPLSPETSVTSQELYTLSQYLQEALHREQVLENKLGTLQRVVANTQDETEFGWKALIEEDRLLSRIETLESQLQTCGKNATDEKLKDEVLKLQEDKDKYQTAAKDSLKNALQEKLEALKKLQDLENSLSNAANECVHLFEDNEKKEQEIKLLLEKTTENDKEISNLTKKLQEVEEKYQDMQSQNAEDKLALENNAEVMRKEEQMLCTKIEELKAETDFAKEQLNAMKAHFDILKKDQSIDGNIETNGNISSHDELKNSTTGGNSETLVTILRSELNRLEHELKRVQKENIKNDSYINTETDSCTTNGEAKPAVYTNNFQTDIQPSKRLFEENRESKNQVDNELQQTKNQLEDVRKNVFSVTRELQFVLNQLSKAKEEVSEKSKLIKDLENRFISLSTENDPTKQKELIKETLDELKYPTISNKLKESEETESSTRLSSINDSNSELISDYDDLKSECAMYKKKVESLQCDLYRMMYDSTKTGDTRIENVNSEVEYRRGSLGKQDSDPSDDLTFNTESEMTENAKKLLHAQEEIILVKERYDECNKEKSYLQCELSALKEQIQLLSVQAKTVSVCSFIPLIVLAVAMMLAFYPTLAHLTATSDQM